MNRTPRISVILAVHDHDCLVRNLSALMDQTVQASEYEVLYVDGEHAFDWEPIIQRTLEMATKDFHVRYLRIPKGGRATSWNRGIRESLAELLLFLANDFIATRGLIEEHLKAHEKYPRSHVVALGPARFPPDWELSPFMRWLEDSGRLFGVSFSQRNGRVPPDFFYGANVSLKKAFLLQAGLFDEDFPHHAWDDYEMGLRLLKQGMKTIYLPPALAYHWHPITLEERQDVMRQAGESAVILEKKYPKLRLWRVGSHVPTRLWEMLIRWSHLRFRLLRREKDLGWYFYWTLAHAFIEGYKKERTRP